jgi:hypothetical protein
MDTDGSKSAPPEVPRGAANMYVVSRESRAAWVVGGVVAGAIAIGIVVNTTTGTSTPPGPMPHTAAARLVESEVVQVERRYHLAPGSPAQPTVSYVDTTAAKAFTFLTGIVGPGIATESGYAGIPNTTLPPPGETTTPIINLLTDPAPVALIEVAGSTFDTYVYHSHAAVSIYCLQHTCPPPKPEIPQVRRSDVAFIVIVLRTGATSGDWEVGPSIGTGWSLSALGKVTSWVGQADFGKPIPAPYQVEQWSR